MFLPPHAQASIAPDRAALFLPERAGRRDDSAGHFLCVGPFHSHTPSSVAAAIATAARLTARRIIRRTAAEALAAALAQLERMQRAQVVGRAQA